VKRYLKDQRVPFKEVNVERDPDAARNIVRKDGADGCAGEAEHADRRTSLTRARTKGL
jgi:hypothetical protein